MSQKLYAVLRHRFEQKPNDNSMGAKEHHISIILSFHHCQHHRFITNPSRMQSPTLQSRNLYTECGPRNNHRDEAHLHPFTALQYIEYHFSINNFNRNTQHVHHLWSSVTFRTSTLPSPYPKVPRSPDGADEEELLVNRSCVSKKDIKGLGVNP